MFDRLLEDIKTVKERDPAASSFLEILFLYPGLKAIRSHRIANWFYRHNMKFFARAISQHSARKTNIEIHPGATIGRRFFIDHGTGVVIGETSEIGDDPVVRAKLMDLQRELAMKENVIMDGRDIGTVVLPNADVKIFLTASSKVRAKRRYDELTEKGVECDFDEIEKDIIDRDYRDMHRETAPLKQAEDAILLDSSELDIDGVVNRMKEIIKEAIG